MVAAPRYNPFKYLAQNPETQFAVMDEQKITLQFEFFDMKYLSNTIKFNQTISDPGIFVNNTEGNIDIDFS